MLVLLLRPLLHAAADVAGWGWVQRNVHACLGEVAAAAHAQLHMTADSQNAGAFSGLLLLLLLLLHWEVARQ